MIIKCTVSVATDTLRAVTAARLRAVWPTLPHVYGPSYRWDAWRQAIAAYNAGEFHKACDWAVIAAPAGES